MSAGAMDGTGKLYFGSWGTNANWYDGKLYAFEGPPTFVKPISGLPDYNGVDYDPDSDGQNEFSVLYRDNYHPAVVGGEGEGFGKHPAVDIRAGSVVNDPGNPDGKPVGVPVRAVANGRIYPGTWGSASNMSGGCNGGWGGLVVIRHDGLETSEPVYSFAAHLKAIDPVLLTSWTTLTDPSQGLPVSKGQIIGTSGGCKPLWWDKENATCYDVEPWSWSGSSTGCHVHFQVTRDTVNSLEVSPVNPIPWFPANVDVLDTEHEVERFTYSPLYFIQNQSLKNPYVDSMSPSTYKLNKGKHANNTFTVTLTGSNFDYNLDSDPNNDAQVFVARASDGSYVGMGAIKTGSSDTQITFDIEIKDAGSYWIVVRNKDGRVSNKMGLTVTH